MTAPLPPNADELVSAYVDGDAAPDEMAIVEANPELMARVDELRTVLDLIAAPPGHGPSPALKDEHLAAALGEFDRLVDEGEFDTNSARDLGTSSGGASIGGASGGAIDGEASIDDEASVVSLAAARERRRPRRLNMVAAAAAAVALLFAGIVAVGINRGGDTAEVVDGASDAVEDTAAFEITESDATAADDAGDDAMADDAADEEELFAAAESAPAQATLGDGAADDADAADAARAEPQPTPPAAGAAPADGNAMADESAADEATDDAEAEFADSDDAQDPLPDLDVLELGEFATLDELEAGLVDRFGDPAAALDEVSEALGDPDVVGSTCELAAFDLEPGRLVGIGRIDGEEDSFFETHVDPTGTAFVVIGIEQPGSCVELARFEN